jgi:hypothetical protein
MSVAEPPLAQAYQAVKRGLWAASSRRRSRRTSAGIEKTSSTASCSTTPANSGHSTQVVGEAATIVTRPALQPPRMPDAAIAWRADPSPQLDRVLAAARRGAHAS